jgi:hypothetical protein
MGAFLNRWGSGCLHVTFGGDYRLDRRKAIGVGADDVRCLFYRILVHARIAFVAWRDGFNRWGERF